jgi:subtilisin family serine protease
MRKMFLLAVLTLAACCGTTPNIGPLGDMLEITSVHPRAADVGDTVTITGTGFIKNLSVKIGNQSVQASTFTDKQLTMKMPNLGRGQYQVEVKNPDGTFVTHQGPVILGKDSLTETGPGSVPSIIDGEVMISFPAQSFKTKDDLENYLKTKFPNLTVVTFYEPIVPGSTGPCGKAIAVIRGPAGASVKDVLNEFASNPELQNLKWIGDPHSQYAGGGMQGKFLDSYGTDWSRQLVQMPNAQAISSLAVNLSNIKVAILDTGVSDHEEFLDLAGKYFIDRSDGKNYTSETLRGLFESTEDGYSTGEISSLSGYGGHGTSVAAIIAALDGNELGNSGAMVGISPGVHVIPIKVCYRGKPEIGKSKLEFPPFCPGISVAGGICHAIAHGARIINLSLGVSQSSIILYQILKEASDNGISIVTAAGNEGKGIDVPYFHFPSAYSRVMVNEYDAIPGLIAVGAVGSSISTFGYAYSVKYSNKGDWIDVVAPGGDDEGGYKIYSAANSFDSPVSLYNDFYGTSFAAPYVTGTVALLRAKYPNLTPSQIKDKIKSSASNNVISSRASKLPTKCPSTSCGAGLLNISKTLDIVQNTGTTISSRP